MAGMGARATAIYPFAIAVALPPAGFFLGLIAFSQEDRVQGTRLILVAAVAAVVWALLLFG